MMFMLIPRLKDAAERLQLMVEAFFTSILDALKTPSNNNTVLKAIKAE